MSSLRDELKVLLRHSTLSDRNIDIIAYKDIAFPEKEPSASIIVCPKEEGDVVKLLRYCNEKGLAVVPWGGGTNLCGALSPGKEHVILDLRQLNRILEVKPGRGFIRAGAGATIEKVQQAAGKAGAFFGHDPWSRKSATVGGSIALDAAGTLYPLYGSMGDMVLSLKLALASGESITIGKELSKSSSAPGLVPLFIGSEGSFCVILEATLKLHAPPELFQPVAYGFKSFEKMFEGLLALRKGGILPDSFIGGTLPKRVTDNLPKKEKLLIKVGNIKAGLYLCCCGKKELAEEKILLIKAVLDHYGRMMPQDYADEWWEKRHTYFEASPEVRAGELYPHVLDLTVPMDKVPAMKNWVEKEVAREGKTDALSHTLFTTPDAYTVAFYLRKEESITELEKRIYRKVVEMGGTITRTHGTGRLFDSALVEKELGRNTVRLLHLLKTMLDPKDILNPGVMNLPSSEKSSDENPCQDRKKEEQQ